MLRLSELYLERKEDRKKEKLHPFERASLCNLVKASDTTPEEAIHWVPSLSRFDEDQLQIAIDTIVQMKEVATQSGI